MGVFKSALDVCIYVVVAAVPTCIWIQLAKRCDRMSYEYNLEEEDHNRHNCLVRYTKANGAVGWPAKHQRISGIGRLPTAKDPLRYESIMYFIYTAKKSIDIAMMVIEIDKFIDSLKSASRRGVPVRLVLDHLYGNRGRVMELIEAGVEVRFYICPAEESSSIMHYKFMVKDYTDGYGFAYVGSMNWTEASIKGNYEATIFTTSNRFVEAMHNCFEQIWNYTGMLSETHAGVKAQLHGVT